MFKRGKFDADDTAQHSLRNSSIPFRVPSAAGGYAERLGLTNSQSGS
jgi:hypothetical protein